jgi:2Fe-2S ferredoxin
LNLNRKTIQFTVIENDTAQSIETYVGQYPNLMFLLRDRLYLDSFGECQGMGRCATCLVKTKKIKGVSLLKERNEPSTLTKMGYTDPSIRLSCQLMISSDLDGSEIEILE